MPTLSCDISESLIEALAARGARTGEPLSHIVMTALADALEVEHSTLFQVSTSGALVKGVYNGVVTIGELKQHGDFGLGTFDGLDGEMLALDGEFYQVHSSGRVSEPSDSAKVPFGVVTAFRAEDEFTMEQVGGFADLAAQLDGARQTENLFYAARIEGRFARIRTRAACKAASGVSLVEATSHQAEFEFADVGGTLVGFWTPTYARSLNVAGWHLHFVTDDRSGGGHLLECQAAGLRVELQKLADVRIAMPETAAFLSADLTQDPSRELDVAEHGGRRAGNGGQDGDADSKRGAAGEGAKRSAVIAARVERER
jgi:acetolactate decarboxylase